MKALTTAIAVLVAMPAAAHAQDLNFGTLEEGTNVATLTTGAEHGLVLGGGYAHVMAVADRPLVLGADLALSAAGMDLHDFRVRAGALVPIVGDGRWKVIGGVAAVVRGTNNDVAQMIDVGTDVAVLAGRYAPRWFAVAEVGFDWAIATHIANSETYRMLAYPDARDGWYRNAGGLLRVGVQSGVSFGGNDIILRAGALRDDAGDPPLLPFYATLSYDRRW